MRRSGGGEPAAAHEAACIVHEVGFAIDDSRQTGGGLGRAGHTFQRVGAVEAVAGVEEHDVMAGGQVKGLVHGIVETVVRLAEAGYFVGNAGHGVTLLVMMDLF